MNVKRKSVILPKVILFLLVSFTAVWTAAQVDPTFAPVLSNAAGFQGSFTVQPNGKIIVYGGFQIIQGVQKYGIARLNADGSLDASFDCAACDWSVGSAVVQPDGKIIIAGALYGLGSANRLRRLNADGSIDSSFTSPFAENMDGFTPNSRVWTVAPNGDIFVSQHFSFMGDPWSYLYRLNANGTIDTAFARMHFTYGMGQFGVKHFLGDLKLLPDGKLMIGGKHDYGFLFRVNPDGTKDNSFVSPVLTSVFMNPVLGVVSFDIQADGKIPLTGYFGFINGVEKAGFARLNADQSVDTAYTLPFGFGSFSSSQKLKLLSSGKLLVSGPFAPTRIARLNIDGTVDNTFNTSSEIREIHDWVLDGSERIIAEANLQTEGMRMIRLNTNGSRDSSFNINFGSPPIYNYSCAVQADGKVVFTGGFGIVNGVLRRNFARVNSDGTLDTSFDGGDGFNRDVYDLAIQPDGKILAAGIFETYNGTPRNSIARVNANGTLDAAFNPQVINVAAVAVQSDGKILVAGDYDNVNGTPRTGISRLKADGSLDDSFNPVLGNLDVVYQVLVEPDGKIVISGVFTSVNGTNRQNVARLNPDGSLDASFNVGSGVNARVLRRQADGKFLTSNRNTIVRRNADGSVDTSFQSIPFDNQFQIYSFLQQADGTIIVSGGFTSVNGDQTEKYLVRLASNGTLMPDYVANGVTARVNGLAKQADNKIVAVGDFTGIGGFTRFGIVRLNYTSVQHRALFDFDGDGKADVSVFRPLENKWFIYRSSDGQITQQIFAVAGDIPAPADFDGDNKTDMAIFRPASGDWWSLSSINNAQVFAHWGANGDIPRPSDFDGDGRADYIIFRASENNWYRLSSATGLSSTRLFGAAGDKPVTGDFDGDGKSDVAIYRPSTGDWWWQSSVDNIQRATRWGISSDIPAPADYDGDGKTDFAVYRPSTGVWYIINSNNGSFTIMAFGLSEDKPIPADYDGDGKADIAVFRPSTGIWYLMRSTAGFTALQFGISTDIPTANAFVP